MTDETKQDNTPEELRAENEAIDSEEQKPERRQSSYRGRGRGRNRDLENEEEDRALPEYNNVSGPGLKPDPKYQSLLVSKFVNCMMWKGKKTTAQRIFYDAMEILEKRTGEDPLKVFSECIENVQPIVEVKSRRVGGATYQVPVPVNAKRKLSLAIRWILAASRAKKGKPMRERLASELLDAYRKEGVAIKKREDTHRMAEANKAFAHFAW